MRKVLQWAGALALAFSTGANAAVVTGGRTSVALDTELLASVGLNLTGVTGPVISPGDLPGSVAFPINAPGAASPALPTTFAYTPGTLAPFSGAIEHSGGVTFNATDSSPGLTVGNFTIAFVGDVPTVFDNVSFPGVPLFTLANLSGLVATDTALQVAGDLLVSTELAGVLGNADLTGADVGNAFVNATARVPEPGALALVLLAGLALGMAQRRRGVAPETSAARG